MSGAFNNQFLEEQRLEIEDDKFPESSGLATLWLTYMGIISTH